MTKKNELAVISKSNDLAMPTSFTPATVVGMNTNLAIDSALLPEDMQGLKFEVIQTGFNPSVVWEKPGDFAAGIFTGLEEKIGPNTARLYNFETTKGKPFSIWGTKVLDRVFDMAMKQGMLKPGLVVMVTYVGNTPSKFADNPTKLFHMQIVKN